MADQNDINKSGQETNVSQSKVYQIRIKGHLRSRWKEWFEGLTITIEEDGNTLLTGSLIDQASLHGILKKVRDLGMPLLSVNIVDDNLQDSPKDIN